MQRPEVIEKLFDIVDETSMMISAAGQMSYLQAICESCQNIISQTISQSAIKEALWEQYDQLEGLEFAREEVRKALQLAILKGLKAEDLTNALMTPDSIALMVGYLISKFVRDLEKIRIADLTVGTGNFLTAVLNQLEGNPVAIYGVDIDANLLQIAYVLADMQEHAIQFFHQSSLESLLIDPLDVIISDLPRQNLENDYLPYLLIENHLKYLKPGGYAFYVIPNDLFSQKGAKNFHQTLTSEANIQALLQLPDKLFKASELGKSLFVLQKQGDNVRNVQEILVTPLPNFSEPSKFKNILNKIEDWIQVNKKENVK